MMFLLLLACARLGFDADHDEGREADPDAVPAEGAAREVTLTPDALATAGITIAPAATGHLPRTLDVPGTLVLDPTAEARLGAPAAGQVSRVLVQAGDAVTAGTVLAWVRSAEVTDARATWATADARRTAALARRDRLKLLLDDGVSSKAQVLDAEAELAEATGAATAAAERLALYGVRPGDSGPDAPIRTPIAGTVLEATAAVGSFVSPETPLFHVGDADHLWLLLAVPDARLGEVAPGQSVGFLVDGAGDEPLSATIAAVGRWVDPSARTVNVRATVSDPEHRLRPNQFARATLALAGDEDEVGIVVPAEAVQSLDGRDVVFIEGESGHFAPRPVEVAARAAGKARLERGVEEGERVVMTGAFALKGQLVKGELGGDDD